MWIKLLLISVSVIGLSYWIGFTILSRVLEEHGFYPGDDGHFHRKEEKEEEPVFTYCLKDSVCEAFRVGDESIPMWATTTPEVDVLISSPPRVVLHREDGTTVTAPEGDYIMYFGGDRVGILKESDLQENFVKIQVQEETE